MSLLISQPPKMNSNTPKNTDSMSIVAPWRIVNIGNNNPVQLMDFISAIENKLNVKDLDSYNSRLKEFKKPDISVLPLPIIL